MSAIPAPLRDMPNWLCWHYEPRFDGDPKARKVPWYSKGGKRAGKQGTPEDRAKLTTFAVARDQAAKRGLSGVGFALLPGCGIVALDFDKCVTDGRVDPEVLGAIRSTYAEYSPSGTGVRAFVRGDLGNRKSHATSDQYGVELFTTTGFCTVTGNALPHIDLLGLEDTIGRVTPELEALCEKRFGQRKDAAAVSDDFTVGHEPPLGLEGSEIDALLDKLDPDIGREDWVRVGMALHHETEGGEDGFDFWHDWSSQGAKFVDEDDLRRNWDSFDRRSGTGQRQVTMASVKWMVQDASQKAAGEAKSPGQASAAAESMIALSPSLGRLGNGSARASQSTVLPAIHATPYRWPAPALLPTRQWLLGHWLLRGEVTSIIAPGGTGKSTIGTALALSLASGQPLLGKPLPRGAQSVWIYNLEDGTEELERQVSAACQFHGIGREDCGDRLHLDSGLVQPLCTAIEDRDGFALAEGVFVQLTTTIRDRHIATVIVDPFVSSHSVQENNNGAIDAIAKRWKRLAQETGCAVVLVHHTKKLGGREVTAEDGRGAVALRDAARVVLMLNSMGEKEVEELGIADPALRRSLVRIDTGKVNRAPPDAATWIKLEGQSLDNGNELEPPDFVGVASLWEKPDVFHGLSTWHLYMVQQGLAAGDWRESVQAKDWVGHLVAKVAGLSAETDKGRIKAMLRTWRKNGALAVERRTVNGRDVPFVIVGKPVGPSEIGTRPHLQTCGGKSAESAGGNLELYPSAPPAPPY